MKMFKERVHFQFSISMWNLSWKDRFCQIYENIQKVREVTIREVPGKSKWKFKMAFAMKGGGGLEGVSFAIKLFWKMIFVKNHLESFPDCENVFCT